MALGSGTRIGPYEVGAQIGVGGMGEVYRATDTVLKRQVALKVLPPDVAADPERIARFQREAETLAALNHPHIAQIYGLERSGAVTALVLELVDGPTLADRIAQGPIPIAEALPIARQIAEALEAAHEKGIIHRDLKPANIKVHADGTVKVLDFGLAKAVEPTHDGGPSASLANSPTITSPAMMTGVGVILGTAGYMSPEQAKGRPADKRSDIWAFGCVLYEMLTGMRTFLGDDVAETLAEVIKGTPDWARLPSALPENVRTLVQRCLEKDRRQRLGDVSTIKFLLEERAMAPLTAAAPVASMRRRLALAGVAIVVAAVAFVAAWSWRPSSSALSEPTRLSFLVPDDQNLNLFGMPIISISRDGRMVAYVANRRLFVYSMLDGTSRVVPGSEIASGFIGSPLFTRDGKSIVYWAGVAPARGSLRRISVQGGAADTIAEVGTPFGMTLDGDDFVFGQATVPSQSPGIYRVRGGGSTPELIVKASPGEALNGAQILPGGEFVLMTVATGDSSLNGSTAIWNRAQIVVQRLHSDERRVILENGSDGRYLPTGHLVFARGGTLLAVPFDTRTMAASGAPRVVLEGVGRMGNLGTAPRTAGTQFSVSDNGVAAYLPGPRTEEGQTDVALVDLKGKGEPLGFPLGEYEQPRVSPDQKFLAILSRQASETSILIHEMGARSTPRRLTIGGRNQFPVWSTDSSRLVFQSDRGGDLGLWMQPADGSRPAERLTTPSAKSVHMPEAWVDAETLWFAELSDGEYALQQLNIRSHFIMPVSDIRSINPFNVNIAPNRRWFVYSRYDPADTSNSVGNSLFMEPYPPTGARFSVAAFGNQPLWSLSSDEVRYNPGPGEMASVHVTTTPAVAFGPPVPFVKGFVQGGPTVVRNYDNAPDGRLVGVAASSNDVDPGVQVAYVVLNWFEELKAKVPVP